MVEVVELPVVMDQEAPVIIMVAKVDHKLRVVIVVTHLHGQEILQVVRNLMVATEELLDIHLVVEVEQDGLVEVEVEHYQVLTLPEVVELDILIHQLLTEDYLEEIMVVEIMLVYHLIYQIQCRVFL